MLQVPHALVLWLEELPLRSLQHIVCNAVKVHGGSG